MEPKLSHYEVIKFLTERGGRCTNFELVSNFRSILDDPLYQAEARLKFKDIINTVAIVTEKQNVKCIELKQEYINNCLPESDQQPQFSSGPSSITSDYSGYTSPISQSFQPYWRYRLSTSVRVPALPVRSPEGELVNKPTTRDSKDNGFGRSVSESTLSQPLGEPQPPLRTRGRSSSSFNRCLPETPFFNERQRRTSFNEYDSYANPASEFLSGDFNQAYARNPNEKFSGRLPNTPIRVTSSPHIPNQSLNRSVSECISRPKDQYSRDSLYDGDIGLPLRPPSSNPRHSISDLQRADVRRPPALNNDARRSFQEKNYGTHNSDSFRKSNELPYGYPQNQPNIRQQNLVGQCLDKTADDFLQGNTSESIANKGLRNSVPNSVSTRPANYSKTYKENTNRRNMGHQLQESPSRINNPARRFDQLGEGCIPNGCLPDTLCERSKPKHRSMDSVHSLGCERPQIHPSDSNKMNSMLTTKEEESIIESRDDAPPVPPERRRRSLNKQLTETKVKEDSSTTKQEEEPSVVLSSGKVKDRIQHFDGMVEKKKDVRSTETVSTGKENRMLKAHAMEDDESISVLDPKLKREWYVRAAQCDYHSLVALLKKEPKLAGIKDIASGYTALHWAAKLGDANIVKLIAGAYRLNPNVRSNGGYTALHLATLYKQTIIADLLLNTYGADPSIRDYSGKRADQYPENYVRAVAGIKTLDRKPLKPRTVDKEPSGGFARIGSLNLRKSRKSAIFASVRGSTRNWGSATELRLNSHKSARKKNSKSMQLEKKVEPEVKNDSDSDSAYGFYSK